MKLVNVMRCAMLAATVGLYAEECKFELVTWYPTNIPFAKMLKEIVEKEGCKWQHEQFPNFHKEVKGRIPKGPLMEMVRLDGGGEEYLLDQLIAEGKIEDLSEVAAGQDWENRFSPEQVRYCKKNGKWYCIPQGDYTTFKMYSKVIARELGLNTPMNYKQMVQDAPKIESAGYATISFDPNPYNVGAMLHDILDDVYGVDAIRAYMNKDMDFIKGKVMEEAINILIGMSQLKNAKAPMGMFSSYDDVKNSKAFFGKEFSGLYVFRANELDNADFAANVDCHLGHMQPSKRTMYDGGDVFAFPKSTPNSLARKAQLAVVKHLTQPEWTAKATSTLATMPPIAGVDPKHVHQCLKSAVITMNEYRGNYVKGAWHSWGPELEEKVGKVVSDAWAKKGVGVTAKQVHSDLVKIFEESK